MPKWLKEIGRDAAMVLLLAILIVALIALALAVRLIWHARLFGG